MNKTFLFTRLDYLTIKPYLTLKTIALFFVIIAFLSYNTGESSMLVGILMMYSTLYASYPFAIGDKNGIDTLYATLPLKKSNIVTGRYLFALSLNVFSGIISFVISAVFMSILKKGFNFKETLITVLICFFIFSILEAIQLPLFFKFGYTKAKFLAYLPIIFFPVAVASISAFAGKEASLKLLISIFSWVENNVLLTVISAIALWSFSLIGSGLLSYRLYKNKEY